MQRSNSDGGSSSGWSAAAEDDKSAGNAAGGWELRPCGLLVQRRAECGDGAPPLPPPAPEKKISVRVKHGDAKIQVTVNAAASFGELKKILAARTGLEPADQQLTYKGKERGNTEFLDSCGVKSKSRLVLCESPASVERRYIERQKQAKLEGINRAISSVAMEVDKLADQVTAVEKSISSRNKVAEVQITTLTELLMRQAVKLESIPNEGDETSLKINMQSKRVQKCVETLDVLKIANARLQPVVVTTEWVTFDPPAASPQWEFFD